jgi:hypothetical protein
LADPCVAGVRRDLTGCGFALVDTPSCLATDLVHRRPRRSTTLPAHDRRWRQFPELARYACWLEALLDAALAEEAVALASLEFRHEPAGLEDRKVDGLHADGSYLPSVWTLCGPATIYRDCGVERPVPVGQTLLMTAMDRARAVGLPCILHRRPGAGPERAVVVCSFEPRPEQSAVASVYRDVVQARRRCRKSRGGRLPSDLRSF